MPNSFTRKTIQVALTLGKGTFSQEGAVQTSANHAAGNTKIIEGLACEATIQKPGLPEKNSASVKIWGMKYDDMAQLAMLSFRPQESQHNLIEIRAGELGGALSLVFQGEISGAFADFNASPNICMQFEASSGIYPQQMASSPRTVQGGVQADKLFTQFAAEANYAYKNEGVTTSVRDAWYSGSPIDKMTKLARDIGCELIIDDGLVLVLPRGKARQGNAVFLDDESGLIGYPTFNQDGISCRCIFNPDLQYGGLLKIKSIVPRASGVWKINKLTHSISAYKPDGGNWESQIEAAYNE